MGVLRVVSKSSSSLRISAASARTVHRSTYIYSFGIAFNNSIAKHPCLACATPCGQSIQRRRRQLCVCWQSLCIALCRAKRTRKKIRSCQRAGGERRQRLKAPFTSFRQELGPCAASCCERIICLPDKASIERPQTGDEAVVASQKHADTP